MRVRLRVSGALLPLAAALLAAPTTSARTWHILPDGSGDAPTIQAGVDSAVAGDVVQLAHGVFTEAGIYLNREIVLRGDPDAPELVVIDGQRIDRILYGRAFMAIEGLTFRNGHASWPSYDGESGGAIRCRAISGSISFCVFDDNKALSAGGGVCLWGASVAIRDCYFIENSAGYGGGGIEVAGGTPEVIDCVFRGNSASYVGGAALVRSDGVRFLRCFCEANTAVDWGGAIHVWGASSTVESCVFLGNEATYGGGMSFHDSCWLASVAHCTFVRNRASEGGALATRKDYMNFPIIESTLIALQVEGGSFASPGLNPGVIVLRCCDIWGNAGGDWVPIIADQMNQRGNLSVNPLFCDPDDDDLTLAANSPCLPGNHPAGWNCGLVGALGQGCGAVALTPQTWARVKATYR